MRFKIDETYSLSEVSMTHLTEAHFDMLQSALKETFDFVFLKPKWKEDDFEEDFTLGFRKVQSEDKRISYQCILESDSYHPGR